MGARAVGVIANPVSGKDIRRLVANAPTSTLQEKYTIVRRVVIGAVEAGVERFFFLPEPHNICARAVETLHLEFEWSHLELPARYDESDTVRAAAALRELGCGAVAVLGGDGTNRAVALGWRDAPVMAISTGTNNVFPSFLEATVAGAAAGLVAAGSVSLEEAARPSKVIDVEIEGERPDLALIDAVLVAERFVGSRALFDPTALRVAMMTRAEPASVGIASIGGLLAPCSAEDDHGVCVRFAPLTGDEDEAEAGGSTRLRAPLAPGLYAEVGIAAADRVAFGAPVTVAGPGILAFDGERHRVLQPGQSATLRITRSGPRVIDAAKVMGLAADRALFTERGRQ
ncbi:MAG: NAD(+)/NADH kinase [Acidimicrobiales bacterium]